MSAQSSDRYSVAPEQAYASGIGDDPKSGSAGAHHRR